jgi:hypothetical protein
VGGEPERAYSERNRLLVASADQLVAGWTGVTGGGTAQTIAFARAAQLPVREIVLEASVSARAARGRGV